MRSSVRLLVEDGMFGFGPQCILGLVNDGRSVVFREEGHGSGLNGLVELA